MEDRKQEGGVGLKRSGQYDALSSVAAELSVPPTPVQLVDDKPAGGDVLAGYIALQHLVPRVPQQRRQLRYHGPAGCEEWGWGHRGYAGLRR